MDFGATSVFREVCIFSNGNPSCIMYYDIGGNTVCVYNEGKPSCYMFAEKYPKDLNDFCDEDLFNHEIFPIEEQDAIELDAVDEFNYEMSCLEELEAAEELRRKLEKKLIDMHFSRELLEIKPKDLQPLPMPKCPKMKPLQPKGFPDYRTRTFRRPVHVLHQPRKGQ